MSLDQTNPFRPLHALSLAALGVAILGLAAFAARAIRGRVESRPTPTIAAAPASPDRPTPAKRGKLLYQVHCVRCHGQEGHGDGPDSADLRPTPRDFASDRWKFGPDRESIRRVIVEGIPGTSMYATGGTFSPRELDALVEHVRSLGPSGESNRKAAGFLPELPSTKAPGFEVEDLEGHRRTLDLGRSEKLTLLVFWGTFCAPCQEELPELQALAEEFEARGLAVIPVCVDEADRAKVARVLRGKFDRSPSYLSTDAMARVRYDLQTLPVAALVDRKGNLLGIARGGVEWKGDAARRLIGGLLAED